MEKEKNYLSADTGTITEGQVMDGTLAYMNEIKDLRILTNEEVISLLHRWRDEGDKEAFNTLVRHNLKLVVSIAQKYKNYGLPMDDLIQYGSIGLIFGIKHFDTTRNIRLSTYVTPWIDANITRELDKNKMIRLPANKSQAYRKIKRIEREWEEAERSGELTDMQLARATGLDEDEVARLKNAPAVTTSIDAPVNSDSGDTTIGEMVADSDYDSGLEAVFAEEQREAIFQTLDKYLDDKEKRVVILRFGLDGHEGRTLEEVGKLLAPEKPLSKEYIRQLSMRAIKKLQVHASNGVLHELWYADKE